MAKARKQKPKDGEVLVQLTSLPGSGKPRVLLAGDKPEQGAEDTRRKVEFMLGASGYLEAICSQEDADWFATAAAGAVIVGDAAQGNFNMDIFQSPDRVIRQRFDILIKTNPERALAIIDRALEEGVGGGMHGKTICDLRDAAEQAVVVRKKTENAQNKAARAKANVLAEAARGKLPGDADEKKDDADDKKGDSDQEELDISGVITGKGDKADGDEKKGDADENAGGDDAGAENDNDNNAPNGG